MTAGASSQTRIGGVVSVPSILKRSKELRQRGYPCWYWIGSGGIALLAAVFLFLGVLGSPAATFLALAAGVLAHFTGQRHRLKQVRTSGKPAELAAFEFDGRQVLCIFDEAAILRFIHSWKPRAASAISAVIVCFAAQHLSFLDFSFLPARVSSRPLFSTEIAVAAACLPGVVGIVFLRINPPGRRWTAQLKAAIQARVDEAIARVTGPGELDGLQAGIEVLWQRVGIDRPGEYRQAIARHLQARTTETVLNPQVAQPLLNATLELARQDLKSLGLAVETYQRIECRWKSFGTLASEFRDPVREMQAEELKAELGQLSRLALHRRWSHLQQHAEWLQSQLDALRSQLRRHAASIPRMTLPPGSDPYRMLGVSVDTPTPLIKKLRIRLAHLYHPDVGESVGNSAKMAELNAAYDAVMKDREREGR